MPLLIYAEQLPVRTYTVADGLAHDKIQQIFRDSHGFLWFSTYDGLSRYDGSHFTNYGVKEGLPLAYTNGITEGHDGIYWIATNGGGISRFDPNVRVREGKNSSPLFTTYPVGDTPVSNRIGIIYEDRSGNIWAGTDGGLFRLDAGGATKFQRVDLNIGSVPDTRIEVLNIVEDEEGSIWIGTGFGLLRRLPDGRIFHYPIQSTAATDYIWDLQLDKEGRLWLGYERGLIVIKPLPVEEVLKENGHPPLWLHLQKQNQLAAAPPDNFVQLESTALPLPTVAGQAVWYTKADGLISENIRAIYMADDGRIWVGTRGGGLHIFDGQHFTNYSAEQGINNNITSLIEDIEGNMWAGTQTGGVLKIARSGFRSFGKFDGLGSEEIVSMFENKAGELYVITNKWVINRFDGKKFDSIHPNLPPAILNSGNGRWKIIQDHLGEWWVTTETGLYRFPKPERFADLSKAPPTLYTTQNGLADNNISRLFEDSRGDIWLASYNPPVMLTRWERATNTFHTYAEADGLPPLNWANDFAEDALGQIWLGMHNGGLVRYGKGNFKAFKTTEKISTGITQGLYIDKSNRLWIATSAEGTGIFSDVSADAPQIENIPAFNKLSSQNLECFVEDGIGHIYIGTARGIDRVGLENGQVQHYSTDDGLPNSEITNALRDRRGALWFGTRKGLARLIPEPEQQITLGPTFINGLKISNVAYPVSDLGQTGISNIELSSNQNQLQFDFFALDFSAGGNLKYQYKFEGLDEDWRELLEQRTFTVNLTPGSYNFLVRAVTSDGKTASTPAHVSFRILPPIWMRWWFIALALLTIGAVIYTFYRYRLQRLLELEKVRTRIATDLHDDIGSSLSQIAILSEVVRQKVGDTVATEPLKLIAEVSREMVDSMSDIVWAINPNKDHLSDLVKRIRRFAGDVLEAKEIKYHLHIPQITHDSHLGTDIRREIYLIFKECINNLVKHSEATVAEVDIKIEHNWFELIIKDNGKGFDSEEKIGSLDSLGGNGLISMRRRAENLGGEFLIDSKPAGGGTRVTLKIPFNNHLRVFFK